MADNARSLPDTGSALITWCCSCNCKRVLRDKCYRLCFEEVSDHALALLLSCTRKVARRDAQVRDGMWNVGGKDPIYRMAGKVFGFLGFGMIAKTLNRKIKGFNFSRVLVYDPFVDAETIAKVGCVKAEWDEVFKESDFISVHMPLINITRNINKEAFQ